MESVALQPEPPGRMEIDLAALRGNFDEIRRRAGPDRTVIAVLKADGYGHGAVAAASALADRKVDYFAAGSLHDAIAIRRAVAAPIIVLGSLEPAAGGFFLEHRLIPSLDDLDAARALSSAAVERPVEVFVKVDAGFGRHGVVLPKAADFITAITSLPGLRLAGVYTHLPFSDEGWEPWARHQEAAFRRMITELRERSGIKIPLVQEIASPRFAIASAPAGEAVAIGHLLYGLKPVADRLKGDMTGIRPALAAIRSRLVHVGERLAGDAAAPYLANATGRLGVVPIGIQHGYRPIRSEAYMIVGGAKAPVLRPCLESTVVDLSAVAAPRAGDEVLLLGKGGGHEITLAELAHWQHSSALAMVTSLSKSLPRTYSGSSL